MHTKLKNVQENRVGIRLSFWKILKKWQEFRSVGQFILLRGGFGLGIHKRRMAFFIRHVHFSLAVGHL